MERLLRNESALDLDKDVTSQVKDRTILKKEMTKKANEKEFSFDYYTSSNAHEREYSKKRE